MATKYSPGLWVAVPNDNGRGDDGKWLVCNARKRGEPADQWGICTIWNQSGGEINGREDKANAKFIAAAPEMAAALSELAKGIKVSECSGTLMLREIIRENKRRIALARAVLAKAGL